MILSVKRHTSRLLSLLLMASTFSACGKKVDVAELLSSDPDIRTVALSALPQISSSKKMALVDPLIDALHDEDSLVIQRAVDALQKLGLQAIPKIVPALKSEDPYIRASAIDIVSSYLDQDPSLIKNIEPLLQDSHPLVQDEAKFALDSYRIHSSTSQPS